MRPDCVCGWQRPGKPRCIRETGNTNQEQQDSGTESSKDRLEYRAYLEQYASAAKAGCKYIRAGLGHLVLNSDFTVSEDKLPMGSFEGVEAVVSTDDRIIGWKVTVPQTGLYSFRLHYYTFKSFKVESGSTVTEYTSKGSAVSRAVYIDGKMPFYDARQVQFTRRWVNETPVKRDEKTDNDLRPFQIEKEAWQTGEFRDYLGYYPEPFSFYLTAGEHIIALSPVSECFAISSLEICKRAEAPTYEELKALYGQKGYAAVPDNDDTYIKIQAEDPSDKSDPTLYAIADRSTPTMEPYHNSKIRLNSIGGDKWQDVGSWMEWEIDVKVSEALQDCLQGKAEYCWAAQTLIAVCLLTAARYVRRLRTSNSPIPQVTACSRFRRTDRICCSIWRRASMCCAWR